MNQSLWIIGRRIPCLAALLLGATAWMPTADAQRVICNNGQCRRIFQPPVFQSPVLRPPVLRQQIIAPNIVRQESVPSGTIVLSPLQEELLVEPEQLEAYWTEYGEDGFTQVIRATVRVTVGGACGSGTIVGRDSQGNAIVLTNAHVAGSSRGRTVNLERWDTSGASERGTGTIIASGYGRGMSVDFALLRCSPSFGQTVNPVPLADRYPDTSSTVTSFGSPRCEWPSLQVLRMNRAEGQVLSWKPEAIGGRSGSSVIDHTVDGPRVVGLLTWAGGGEGMGQSTPFLLNAMRGQLPATIESLPPGTREVETIAALPSDESDGIVYQVPASTSGQPLALPIQLASLQVQDDLIDSITEKEKPKPQPNENPKVEPETPETPTPTIRPWQTTTGTAVTSSLVTLLLVFGVPMALRFIRQWRIDRGQQPLLSEEQFQELVQSVLAALGGLDAGGVNSKAERPDGK